MNETNENTPVNETAPADMPRNPFGDTPQPDLSKPQFEGTPQYAGFLKRFVAVLIDGILIGIVSAVISMVLSVGSDEGAVASNFLTSVLMWIYSVFMLVKFGQTLGKKAMGIKVVKESGQPLDVGTAILREVVGKFISSLVLALGYLWALWDPKKQTWHDKIAKTFVVESK